MAREPAVGGSSSASASVSWSSTSEASPKQPAVSTPWPWSAAGDSRQQAQQGRIVEAIEVIGNERVASNTVLFYMSTRVGAPFDVDTGGQDFRSLLNTGFFENLSMSWRDGEEGIIVEVVVEELPLLRQIRIEGTEKVKPEQLLERLQQLEMPVRLDVPINMPDMRRVREVLMALLQGDEGLQFVQVDLDTEPSQLGAGVDAVYQVTEGDEVRIARVLFRGGTVFSQRELRWHLSRTGEHWLMSFLTKNDRFSWGGFERDMNSLANAYRNRGYLDFRFEEPDIEVHEVDGKRRLFVTIPIFEGNQYRVGEINIEGNTHFTDEELLRVVLLRPGDIVNVEDVLAARDAMQTMYGEAGYLQIAVFPIPDSNPATGVAGMTYRVEENQLYHIRRIEFMGNTHTRDHVLRRNLRVNEGSRWNQNLFQRSLMRLYQLGYFQGLDPELIPLTDEDDLEPDGSSGNVGTDGTSAADAEMATESAPEGRVDVRLKVQEIGRNQISFGGGLSALEGGFIQFGYTTRNLFGYGQTLGLNGQFGSRRTLARLSFTEPYFLGKRLRFGADLFRDKLDFPDFQRGSTGFSARLGLPIDNNDFLVAFLEYNFEVIDIGDIGTRFSSLSSPLFNALFLTEGRRVTSSVRPFIVYNSVDNPFNPSRGFRVSASYEIAGGRLGGSLDFWKASTRATFYLPIIKRGSGYLTQAKQILALNLQVGYAEPTGDLEQLPIFERFFLGGSQSVRGTRLRGIGPIDTNGNILGGDKMLQYNIEYIFQVAEPLRLVFFQDAGQAWLGSNGPNFKDLRKTAGVEARIFVPMFNVPMRFFWAYNFDPLESFGEEKSTFEFAIGSTF